MKPFTLFLMAAALTCPTLSTAQPSQCALFDDGWQFTRNGQTVSVDLPHDWDIYCVSDPATGATGTGGGWYPAGKGEYRKTFLTPAAERVKLHFEGVYQQAEVFVNGRKAGQHGYGYTPFTLDVTPFLNSDRRQPNEVVVKVDNSQQPNCRWYSGSGIYRHVWLQTMPALHIAENGIVVRSPQVTADLATVNLSVSCINEGAGQSRIDDIEVVFSDAGFVADTPAPASRLRQLMPGEQCVMNATYTIRQPRLWSPDSPTLYHAVVRLKAGGRTIDEQQVSFGLRSVSFDARQGFRLNGQPLLINGACLHHDDGVLGAMAFDQAEIRKVLLMKEAGFNLIRTSHNPPSRAFLDACDSIGIMVIDEAFDGWRTAKNPFDYSTLIDSCYRDDIHAMVLRDRLHPSIISWSIGNEVIERKEIRVVTTARQLKQAILEVDDTRPVTEALCAWDRDWEIYDPHAEVLDVVGYNYMIFKHASDHQRDPERVMWQTESYPRDAFNNWAVVNDYPYVVGDMVWTGLDYLGESGIGRYYYEGERPGESFAPGGQPDWHGACCGDVDITGWRKPISHYRSILWNGTDNGQTLYMAVREPNGYHGNIKETMWSVWPTWESWNWQGWEGKPIEVEVYTKEPQVTLSLNGQTIGTQQVSRATRYKAVFTLPYQPGTLTATAGNSQVQLQTAGQPARLRLTPGSTRMKADGQSLAFITVEVVDAQGRTVPDAAVTLQANVSGQCRFMAAASADLKDRETVTSPTVTTWKGRALVVVRSTAKPGRATVSLKANGLPTASVTLKSEK